MRSDAAGAFVSPLLTVAIPSYNRAAMLKRSVLSALEQDGGDYEVLVLDDASTDGSREWLERVSSRRLRKVLHPERKGMAANWNQCVRESLGEFVLILQDDDFALPHLAERLTGAIRRRPEADLLVSTTLLTNADDTARWVFWQTETEELLPPPAALLKFAPDWRITSTQVCFRRELVGDPAFDPSLPIMSDAEAILRWMVSAPTLLIPEPLAVRTVWEGSVTSETTRSEAMAETMRMLVASVERAASGRLSAQQMDDLRGALHSSFIVPYAL